MAELYTDEQRNQFYELLETYPNEVAGLRAALVEGRINGVCYWDTEDCVGCLLGTIAHLRGESEDDILFYNDGSISPVEALAYTIYTFDTPATNPISALLVGWIDSARPGLLKDGE